MAITGPTIVFWTWYDNNNLGTYNTNLGVNPWSGQLVAGRRYYLTVESSSSGAAEAVTSVVHDPTGTPTNFSLLTDGTTLGRIQGYGISGNTLEVWEANVTSTTASAGIRITYAGTQSACGAGMFYVEGEDDTNTTVQVKLGTGSGTLPAPATMNTFGATDNVAILVVATDSPTNTITATESRTKLYENNEIERNNHAVFYQNPHGGDTTLNASITSDSWAAIGFELRAAGTGGPVAVAGTDTATTTDTRTGFTANWQLAETATVTDTRTTQAQVAPTDAATLAAETLNAITVQGIVGEPVTLGEALAIVVPAAPAADTVTLATETARFTLGATASADTATVTDAAVPQGQLAPTDSATVTDALTSVTGDGVPIDTITLTEIASATLTVVPVADTGLLGETESAVLTGPGAPTAIGDSDLANLVDGAVPSFALVVTAVADTGTATDAHTIHVDIVAVDSLSVTEVAVATLDLIASDAATLADVATLAQPLASTGIDSLTVTEALTALAYAVVSVDSLTVSEAVGTIPLEGLTASDALTLTEVGSPLAAWTLAGTDTMTVSETELAKPPDIHLGEPTYGTVALGPRIRGGP